ncbi:glycosyltransferase family 4 protein [bacterium]|nr:glycosyltransferase family 4 protein [bacterium]
MRVCFIEDTDLRGGTQIWVSEAVRIFISRGTDVTVLTSKSGWLAQDCAGTGAKVVTYDYDKVTNQDEENVDIWAEALRDSDVAVCTVHPSRDGFHCSVFAGKVISEKKLKTILIPKTGTIVPEYKREYYVPVEDIKYKVIAITDFTRKYLIDTYKIPAENVELIYQGTEVAKFTKSPDNLGKAKTAYSLPENAAPILGNVGSFEERKGQVVLLEALLKMKNDLPDVHLMLVGDGPDEQMLKQKVKDMNLESSVSFFSFTSTPQLIFEIVDILVLSSLYKEGLPNVLLEAMSMELPVVSSNLAGVPEIVKNGETGYMVKPGDIDELSEAVIKLWLDKNDYNTMAKNARKLMETKFDKKRQFDEFLNYFKQLTTN